MKTLILSAGLALGLGAAVTTTANAAPISTPSIVVAPASAGDVACRTVKKVTVRNGVKKVVTSQSCGDDRRPNHVERRVIRRDRDFDHRPRPGLSIRVN